jgi:hypothetical protein
LDQAASPLHYIFNGSPRILILEKEHYPRHKLCAGGLTLDAEIILERLGLDVNEVPHVFANDIHFDFEAKGLNIRIPKRHALCVIRRNEFDNWLTGKAKERGIPKRTWANVDIPLGYRTYHLLYQVAVVADHETNGHVDRAALCFELGETALNLTDFLVSLRYNCHQEIKSLYY